MQPRCRLWGRRFLHTLRAELLDRLTRNLPHCKQKLKGPTAANLWPSPFLLVTGWPRHIPVYNSRFPAADAEKRQQRAQTSGPP